MRTDSQPPPPRRDSSPDDPACGVAAPAVCGPLRRAVFTLAIPVLGEQLLNSLVGVFDVFLAGQISVDATAAIGLAAYVAWLISMLFMLVGTGTTALVSRSAGAGRRTQANHFSNQSLGLAAGMGIVAAAMIYVLAPTFAGLQNMAGARYDTVVRYLRIEGMGHVFTSVTLVGAAALRGVGDMRTPLKVLTVVNVVNIIVSYAFVFGAGPVPELGIDGIIIGTVTGRVIGGLLIAGVFIRGRSGLKVDFAALKPIPESARRILRIGGPAALDGLVMWTGHFIYLKLIAHLAEGTLGAAYYAAHIVAVRIEAFTYLPAVAYATATATIVGQSLGARDHKRAIGAGHEAVLQCGVLAVVLTALYFLGADLIFAVMQEDSLVNFVGPPAMRLLAFYQVFLTTSIVYVGALRGAGDTRFPVLLTIVSVGCVRLPLGYLGGYVLEWGLMGAWMGMCGDMTVRAVLAALRFGHGKWLHTKV